MGRGGTKALSNNHGLRHSDPGCYKYLFDLHPLPAWIYDPETLLFLAANCSAAHDYGLKPDDFAGMRVPDILTGDADARQAFADFAGGPPGSKEIEGVWGKQNGISSLRTVMAYSHSLEHNGRASRMLLIHDVSNGTRTEEDLRLLAAAFLGSSESMLILDSTLEEPGPRILFANPAFASISGYLASEMIGQTLAVLHGPRTDGLNLSRMRADLQESGSSRYRSVNYRKDGSEFLCDWQISPVRERSGTITHLLSLQRDVTQEVQFREQMQQSQKMEAVGRLAGGIAHDFNNLLTIILGYAGILSVELSKSLSIDDKQFRSLHEIQRASEKAAALTGQLLAFSRKQVPRPRVIDLNPVIRNLESMLRRLIGEDIDLEFKLDEGLGPVQSDAGQFEQLLMNLAVNARDAMPEGGMLTIESSNAEITSRHAPASAVKPGQYVVLSVTDTGIGMDDETRARIFEPFFTTKEPGRGTGLGLSTVYAFVKQCGGSISVSSKSDQGACFKIYLPRANAAATAADEDAALAPRRGSGVVLVVEDESGIRELIRELLEGAGYQVFTAANGPDAVNFVKGHTGPLDLLLTDVVLPGTSGPDLAETLKAIRPGLRVLFASGYSDHALLRKGALGRGAAFMQKPFDTDTMLAFIGNLMTPEAVNTQAR